MANCLGLARPVAGCPQRAPTLWPGFVADWLARPNAAFIVGELQGKLTMLEISCHRRVRRDQQKPMVKTVRPMVTFC